MEEGGVGQAGLARRPETFFSEAVPRNFYDLRTRLKIRSAKVEPSEGEPLLLSSPRRKNLPQVSAPPDRE